MLIGLVGKPSVGKSSFFKAATMIDVKIAAYPFTTIEPNNGMSFVRVQCVDKELNTQCNPAFGYCINHVRYVPVELMDVAGLVPGSHEGRGRGNEFLNDLSQADVLIHIIDISGSTNELGEIIQPLSYDPAKDIKFLEFELDMWYFGVLKRSWGKLSRQIQQSKTDIIAALAKQFSSFKLTEALVRDSAEKLNLDREKPAEWSEDSLKKLTREFRKATKPILVACNKIDVGDSDKNFNRLKAEFPELTLIPCSADAEIALREASKKGLIKYSPGDSDFEILKKESLSESQLKALEFIRRGVLHKYGSTGIQKTLDVAVFDFLKYIAVFPGGINNLKDRKGRVLPDCFLMPKGSTVLDFAFKIHTDFGKNFLYAMDVRTRKRISGEQKLKNRDVIEIISAAK